MPSIKELDNLYDEACTCLNPIHPKHNKKQGIQLLQKISFYGHTRGQFHLAICYQLGYGISINIKNACRYLVLSAISEYEPAHTKLIELAKSHPEAQYVIGKAYVDGLIKNINFETGISYLMLAHKNKHATSMQYIELLASINPVVQYHLGIAQINGYYVKKNYKAGYNNLIQSGEKGFKRAITALAHHEKENQDFVLINIDDIFDRYKSNLESDSNNSINNIRNLAICYNHIMSQFFLGQFYKNNNIEESAMFFQLASINNHAESQWQLSLILSSGNGIERNDEMAETYKKLAINNGFNIDSSKCNFSFKPSI